MAGGAVALSVPGARAGVAVAAAVGCLMLGTLLAVALAAGGGDAWRPGRADLAALRFTVMQAALSAALSVALAVPVARALARRRFPGRRLLIAALGIPFLLPVIVAVQGLLAVFGRAGFLNAGLGAVGLGPVSIYGMQGVVLAHVFLNLPLAVRMLLQGWQAIPSERFRLAAALGFGPGEVWRHLERPMLRAILPGALLAVFLICLTSFAVALILGGGPRATTLELAIYQAIRFEFDLSRAAGLAAAQVALSAAAVGLAALVVVPPVLGGGIDRPVERFDAGRWFPQAQDAAVLGLAGLFLMAPLGFVVHRGLGGLADMPAAVWPAALRSAAIAVVSAILTTSAALFLAQAVAAGGRLARPVEAVAMVPLAASSLVLGTGLFLIVFPLVDPARLALPVTAVVNAVLALPFALRILLPEVRAVEATQGRLAVALGMGGWSRLRLVSIPRLRRPLGFATGLAAALSVGDLGAIALFAREGGETLPLLTYRLMGSYRTDAAAGAALVLVCLGFVLFWLFDRGGRGRADA